MMHTGSHNPNLWTPPIVLAEGDHPLERLAMAVVHHRYTTLDGRRLFFREAGDPLAPTVVLLHGFPTSSYMYRHLIPALADRYHVVAPDHLGFGLSESISAGFSTWNSK